MAYIAYDLLWLNGHDLRAYPLIKRKAGLHEVIPRYPMINLYQVPVVEEQGRELFEVVQRMDLEGIVAKRQAIRMPTRPSGTRSRTRAIVRHETGLSSSNTDGADARRRGLPLNGKRTPLY